MSEKEVAWDLTEIFMGYDDPKVAETMNALIEEVDEFVKQYKGKVNTADFSAQNLYDLLKKHEKILAGKEELEIFCMGLFYANMIIPENKALFQKYQDFEAKFTKKLAFLELEIGDLVHKNPQLINKEYLNNYRYYLDKIKRKLPFKLSEVEELLILEKDDTGVKAWEQLKDSWLSSRKFKVTIEGKEKIVSISEFTALTFHTNRDTRISTFKSVCGSLEKDEEIYSSALRHICNDWVKTVNRRHYNSPIHQSLLDNNISQNIMDNLIRTIEKNIEINHRFLAIKAKLLDLPKLNGADLWALLPFEKTYTWEEAKDLIIQIYGKTDKEIGEFVSDTFHKNHVDASIREGKLGSIMCGYWYKGKSAFVFTTFKGLISELSFLAHEIGHGVHYYLSSREQTFFNYFPGKLAGEIASIFGELLLNEHLMNTIEPKNQRISLLTNQITLACYHIFNTCAAFRFEQNLYNAIREGVFLDGSTISQYWCTARNNVFGDLVEWFDEMKWIWITLPHYFLPNNRFYNYPYAYSQLFVYALYRTYKEEGEKFIPKFKKLLSAGGSLSPEELGKIVGLDITTPDFWQLGIRQYEEFVNELKKLVS